MRVAGIWLAVIGYTVLYVGLENLRGHTISFVGAIQGEQPTSQQGSAQAQPSPLDIIKGGVLQGVASGISPMPLSAKTQPAGAGALI